MVRHISRRIIQDYPEFVELSNILSLAAITWPRFGISALDISEMDDLFKELVYLYVTNGNG